MPTPFRSTIFTGGAFSASGSNGHPSAGLLIYSASRSTAGVLPLADLSQIGRDIFLYVSGVRGSKGTTVAGSTLVDGDMIVSGTIYDGNGNAIGPAGSQPSYFTSPIAGIVETTGSLIIDGNLVVQGTATQIETINLRVKDSLILIGSGAIGTNRNGGIALASGSSVADQSLVWGRVAPDTWGAGRYDVSDGVSVNVVPMTLTPVRASRYEIGGPNAVLSSSNSNDVILQSSAAGQIRVIPGGIGLTLGINSAPVTVSGSSVLIGSGSSQFGGELPNHPGSDSYFFVSGSVLSRGSSVRGVAVFGGDTVISGGLSQGRQSAAFGIFAHAEGRQTNATGGYSHAEGWSSWSDGAYSHAEGTSRASGDYSHAEGVDTNAVGTGAHTEGDRTYAPGLFAHAEGLITTASGDYSHAEGQQTFAFGNYSKAVGFQTVAIGGYSYAGGEGTIASGAVQYVIGRYNNRGTTNALFVIGNGVGTSDAARSDVFVVRSGTLGNGRVEIIGQTNASGSVYSSGVVTASLGFSGSLTRLFDGRSYLVAGTSISIASSSNGQVTISSTGGGGTPGGLNTYVQFNDSGSFGGTSVFSFEKATGTLSVGNITLGGNLDTQAVDSRWYLRNNSADALSLWDGSGGSRRFQFNMGDGQERLIAYDSAGFAAGDSGDLEILHDGTNSYIKNSTGNFFISGSTNGVFITGSAGLIIGDGSQPTLTIRSSLDTSNQSQLYQESGGDTYLVNSKTGGKIFASVKTTLGVAVRFIRAIPNSVNYNTIVSFLQGLHDVFDPQTSTTDVNFYVGGKVGSKGTSGQRGTALFAGDLVVSGSTHLQGGGSITGSFSMQGSIIPSADSTYTLGTSALRWGHVYTGDLHLRNERGDWTILEEPDYLCVINNRTGKKYKMMLQPLD